MKNKIPIMASLPIFTLHPQGFVLKIYTVSQKQHNHGQQHQFDMCLAKRVDAHCKDKIIEEIGPQKCNEHYKREGEP